MPALQWTDETETATSSSFRRCPLETGLRRVAPSLSRAVTETAEAFFGFKAIQGIPWEAPRIPDNRALYCSQENIGEKYEFLLNLTTDKIDYDRLFAEEVGDQIRMDAYCELANCICGAVLADPAFSDEFGYLIPCVPCNGASRPDGEARSERGSMIVGGAWIHFSFSVQECASMRAVTEQLSAAA